MPKKQPTLQQSFSEQFPLMKQRIDTHNKGLTLKQSKLAILMLQYLLEREKRLTKQSEDAMSDAEYIKSLDERLIANWNGLTDFLSQEFSIKVWGGVDLKDRSEVWTVEYSHGSLTGYKTMHEAFRAGIEASLATNEEEVK